MLFKHLEMNCDMGGKEIYSSARSPINILCQ